MRQRLGIGMALVMSGLLVAAAALLVGCGPAVQAEAADQSPFGNGINPAAYFDLHPVGEMGAMGLQHSGESTVTVAYTATFSVRGPHDGVWMDSMGAKDHIHFDGEIARQLESTVYRLPWQESEDGSLIVDEVLTQTVNPPRSHRYVGRWHQDEESVGFELSVVSLDGGQAVGFLFPKALYRGDLDDLPEGINHWYWWVVFDSQEQTRSGALPGTPSRTPSIQIPTPTGIPPGHGAGQ